MKIAKLAEMTEDELRREESSLQERIFRLRFQIGTGNIENPSKLGETRRDLARVKTLLRERELRLVVSHQAKESESAQPGGKSAGETAGASSEAK